MATGYTSIEPTRPPPARMTAALPSRMSMAPPAQMTLASPAQRNIAPIAVMTATAPRLFNTPSSPSLVRRQGGARATLGDPTNRQNAAAHLSRILASLFQAYPHAQQVGDVGNIIQQMGVAARRGEVNELLRLHGTVLAILMIAESNDHMR